MSSNELRKSFFSEKKNAIGLGITAFDKEMCDKFVIIGIVTFKGLSENRILNLASFTTHLLEHFYGKQRRLCLYDHREIHFSEVASDVLLYSIIENDLETSFHQKSRASDSGVLLSSPLIGASIGIIEPLKLVYKCYKIAGFNALYNEEDPPFAREVHKNAIDEANADAFSGTLIENVEIFFKKYTNVENEFKPSTTEISKVCCSTQKKNFIQHSQFKQYCHITRERSEVDMDPDYVDQIPPESENSEFNNEYDDTIEAQNVDEGVKEPDEETEGQNEEETEEETYDESRNEHDMNEKEQCIHDTIDTIDYYLNGNAILSPETNIDELYANVLIPGLDSQHLGDYDLSPKMITRKMVVSPDESDAPDESEDIEYLSSQEIGLHSDPLPDLIHTSDTEDNDDDRDFID